MTISGSRRVSDTKIHFGTGMGLMLVVYSAESQMAQSVFLIEKGIRDGRFPESTAELVVGWQEFALYGLIHARSQLCSGF